MKCAANPSPTKSQKSDRILRIIATETPSLNERPSERSVAVVVPSSTPSPKGTNEATSWAHSPQFPSSGHRERASCGFERTPALLLSNRGGLVRAGRGELAPGPKFAIEGKVFAAGGFSEQRSRGESQPVPR